MVPSSFGAARISPKQVYPPAAAPKATRVGHKKHKKAQKTEVCFVTFCDFCGHPFRRLGLVAAVPRRLPVLWRGLAERGSDGSGGTPKPARETRALPGNLRPRSCQSRSKREWVARVCDPTFGRNEFSRAQSRAGQRPRPTCSAATWAFVSGFGGLGWGRRRCAQISGLRLRRAIVGACLVRALFRPRDAPAFTRGLLAPPALPVNHARVGRAVGDGREFFPLRDAEGIVAAEIRERLVVVEVGVAHAGDVVGDD